MASFLKDTRVEPVTGSIGVYRAEVTDRWNAPVLPQGGVLTAMAIRAMAHALDEPQKRLRSVTTVFAAQVHSGPVEIKVDILRRGKAVSQMISSLRNLGVDAGHTSIAIFGADRPGFEFTDVAPPPVAEPEACPSLRDTPPEGVEDPRPWRLSSFWQNVELRTALGHRPWETWTPTTSDSAAWLRYDEPPRLDHGLLDPLALVALCDTMPSAVGERLGPDQPLWMAPSADLTVHLLGEATSEWLLAHKRARFAGDGYASLELSLWDRNRLVAYATQMMIFSFPDALPDPEELRRRGEGNDA